MGKHLGFFLLSGEARGLTLLGEGLAELGLVRQAFQRMLLLQKPLASTNQSNVNLPQISHSDANACSLARHISGWDKQLPTSRLAIADNAFVCETPENGAGVRFCQRRHGPHIRERKSNPVSVPSNVSNTQTLTSAIGPRKQGARQKHENRLLGHTYQRGFQ